MSELLRLRVKQLKALMERNPKPPFEWKQCYEMPDGSVHWALVDPVADEQGRVSCCYMVLEASFDRTMSGGTVATEPLPMLVAEALNALPELIEFYEKQQNRKLWGIWSVATQRWAMQNGDFTFTTDSKTFAENVLATLEETGRKVGMEVLLEVRQYD